MKRALIALTVVVLALVAIGVAGHVRRAHREAAQRAAEERIIAAHPLEVAAASIDADRRTGFLEHFAIVPQSRPPGIIRMEPSDALADNGITDIYEYGAFKVAVNFTGVPGEHPCGDQPCIREATLNAGTSDAPSLRHVAVWLIGPASSATTEVRRFWAKTRWVTMAEAKWFADLSAQGEIYLRR